MACSCELSNQSMLRNLFMHVCVSVCACMYVPVNAHAYISTHI